MTSSTPVAIPAVPASLALLLRDLFKSPLTSGLEFSPSIDAPPCKPQTLRTLCQSCAMTSKISKTGTSTSTVVCKSTTSRMRTCLASLPERPSSLRRACKVGAAFWFTGKLLFTAYHSPSIDRLYDLHVKCGVHTRPLNSTTEGPLPCSGDGHVTLHNVSYISKCSFRL